MSGYMGAQVCLNGHTVTASMDGGPHRSERFCSKCGEPTITQCPHCPAFIRGEPIMPQGVFVMASFYRRPSFCHNCGKPFPWTENAIANAMELAEEGGDLSTQELQQLRVDLQDLTKDSPRTQVASIRFKKMMAKLGGSIGSGVKDIMVDVLSEAAKKILLPP